MTISFSIFSLGDKAQLHFSVPFQWIARKIRLMQSIFDLAISTCMKHFAIEGQHRCNSSYQTFLSISLHLSQSFFENMNDIH